MEFESALLILAGLIAFVLPGLVLFTRWSVATQVAIFEPDTRRPRVRSTALTHGVDEQVFMVLATVGLIAGAASVLIVSGLPGRFLRMVVAEGLLVTYAASVRTVLYDELRKRMDGEADTAAKAFD
ncbi:MAG: hypothetical protein JST92_15055 [Deltaproteobacteria bacterium]|nr:hypothetical protein [Deltaproteobacteria bacterium]